jgi:hypothetical protein
MLESIAEAIFTEVSFIEDGPTDETWTGTDTRLARSRGHGHESTRDTHSLNTRITGHFNSEK